MNTRQKIIACLTFLAVGVGLIMGMTVKAVVGLAFLGVAAAVGIGSNDRRIHLVFGLIGAALFVLPLLLDWIGHHRAAAKHNAEIAEFRSREAELARSFPLSVVTCDMFSSSWVPIYSVKHISEFDRVLEKAGYADAARRQAVDALLAQLSSQTGLMTVEFPIQATKPQGCRDPWEAYKVKSKPPKNTLDQFRPDFIPDRPPDFIPETPKLPGVGKRGELDIKVVEFEFSGMTGLDLRSFFAEIPDWHKEALRRDIEIWRVPLALKPGPEPEPFRIGHSVWNHRFLTIPGLLLVITETLLFLFLRNRSQMVV